jgi:uncharacterized membrane protein
MKIGTTRVEAFSDGVIAIIITIMVLLLKLPNIDELLTARALTALMHQQAPYFGAYVFSFMMVGIFWTNHHHMFHLLEKTDERLLLLNLFFLFWMSLIPYTTALIGANPLLSTSAALYGFVLLMTTLSLALMRNYTLRKKLVHRDKDRALTTTIYRVSIKARTRNWVGTAAYLLSIPLAYLNIYLAFVCFLIPPIIFFIPHGIDDEDLAARVEKKNA